MMEVIEENLRQRYSKMENGELLDLLLNSDLTTMASNTLEEILAERGVIKDKQEEVLAKFKKESTKNVEFIDFTWWVFWGWLGLTLGNLYLVFSLLDNIGLATSLVITNSILLILVLKFNKYAFLLATIISFNPILWIVNGFYLRNRWHHPKVNTKKLKVTVSNRGGKGKFNNKFKSLSKEKRVLTSLLVVWLAWVVLRTSGNYEIMGTYMDRWDRDMFLVNLLLPMIILWILLFLFKWIKNAEK